MWFRLLTVPVVYSTVYVYYDELQPTPTHMHAPFVRH